MWALVQGGVGAWWSTGGRCQGQLSVQSYLAGANDISLQWLKIDLSLTGEILYIRVE